MKGPIRYSRLLLAAGACLSAASAHAAGGTPVPSGAELSINGAAQNSFAGATVAMNQDGSFVATWVAVDVTQTYMNVYARRFAADGSPLGPDIQVNDTPGSIALGQYFSSANVVVDGSGNFLVTWVGGGIRGHRLSADGTSLGADFQIDNGPYADVTAEPAAVAMDDAGNFVAAWQATRDLGNGSYWSGIVAERFAANGAPRDAQPIEVSANDQPNSTPRVFSQWPAVAINRSTGAFVVAWDYSKFWFRSLNPARNTASGQILARRYNDAGVAQGLQLTVASTTYKGASSPVWSVEPPPAVAMDGAGNFSFAWIMCDGIDATPDGVFMRKYTASGKALGAQVAVSTDGFTPPGSFGQQSPGLVMQFNGDAIVEWSPFDPASVSSGLLAQRVAANGALEGSVFGIAPSNESLPFVESGLAIDDSGSLVAVWNDNIYDSNDNLVSTAINGQLFKLP